MSLVLVVTLWGHRHQVSWLTNLGQWWCYQSSGETSSPQQLTVFIWWWYTAYSCVSSPSPFPGPPSASAWPGIITSFWAAPFQPLLLPPQTRLVLRDCPAQDHFTCLQPNSLTWLLGVSPYLVLSCFIFHYSPLMPIICLWPGGQSWLHAALSLATPCLFSASSTSQHLQNTVSALPDSTTPNSCFHTGEHLWVWLTSVSSRPSEHLPGTPWHWLPLPAQDSLHSSLEFPQEQIIHGATSDLWDNLQESSRGGREDQNETDEKDSRKTSRKKRPDIKQGCVRNIGFYWLAQYYNLQFQCPSLPHSSSGKKTD